MRKIVTAAAAILGTLALVGSAEAAALQSTHMTDVAIVETAANVQMMVSHATAHLRKEPNTKSPILETLKKGATVTVLDKVAGGKWAHVKTDKTEGYIALSLLK